MLRLVRDVNVVVLSWTDRLIGAPVEGRRHLPDQIVSCSGLGEGCGAGE